MSRRSTRLGAKVEAAGAVSLPVASSSAQPATKRLKVASETVSVRGKGEDGHNTTSAANAPKNGGKSKTKRGRSKNMLVEMPVDILIEIFQVMDAHPVDLLNLARTDRALRAFILRRSVALRWWEAAFARVEPKPPVCPDDLSLPQYANLLYGRTCFYCNTTSALTRSWLAYVRICRDCLKDSRHVFQCMVNGSVILTCIHSLFVMVDSKTKRDFQLGRITSPIASASYRYAPLTYVRDQYEKNQEALEQLDLKGNKEALDAFIEDKASEVKQREQLAQPGGPFYSWDVSQQNAKKRVVERQREERKQAVLDKVKELGYAEELRKYPWKFADLPGIKGVRPLTEKEWERMKPGILAVFDKWQHNAEHVKMRNMISDRTDLLSGILRHFTTHNPQWDLPTYRCIREYLDEIPKALKGWREEAEEVLLGMIPSTSTWKSGGTLNEAALKLKGKATIPATSVLNLATTIFCCKWCGPTNPLIYPFVLQHECLFKRHAPGNAYDYIASNNAKQRDRDRREVVYLNEEDRADPNPSWNEGGNQLSFFGDASEFATAIVTALGEDPNVVTWQELDRANHRLECLRCRRPKASAHKRHVMDWRQAVLHELDSEKQHRKLQYDYEMRENLKLSYKAAWTKLDDQSLKKAYAKESSDGKIVTRCPDAKLYCLECWMTPLKDDGTPDYKKHCLTSVKRGDVRCTEGHLLENHGIFTRSQPNLWGRCLNESFSEDPKPVKIS
ncbi:hypothetical protein NMY22_g3923 [Coprinellus aureogranulatus]|nr:hypothetical protein NMY22_g3923 [Coprinellus aureogranulatus]